MGGGGGSDGRPMGGNCGSPIDGGGGSEGRLSAANWGQTDRRGRGQLRQAQRGQGRGAEGRHRRHEAAGSAKADPDGAEIFPMFWASR